jgi:CBS domain containing-hemolysin-like protein
LSTRFFENTFLLLILLALSFFFSGSETALFSLPRVVIERLRQGSASGKRIAHMLEDQNRLLITILLGNLAVNILISEMIGVWSLEMFRNFSYSYYIGSIVAILATTGILLVFAEITPKIIAINNAELLAQGASIPLDIFSKIVYPIVRALLLLTNGMLYLMGIRKGAPGPTVTEDELKTIVAMGEEEGVLESSERMMINRIIEFGDTLVRDVYVPRADMVRVRYDTTVEQLSTIMRETGHSRFPVYGRTVDDIKGIVYAKDLFPYFWRGQTRVPISRFVRPPHYVPETMKVYELLTEFQTGRLHMAIVVGEYGGTKGIVTLEDLIEEVVGDIFDEYDVRESLFERQSDGSHIVNAHMKLDDLSDVLGASVRAPGCDTVGGLLYTMLAHVPTPDESVDHAGYRFIVKDMKGRRIRMVHVGSAPATNSGNGGGEGAS